MTVLVTGGCGFLGSQFVHTANDEGIATIVLDDVSRTDVEAIPAYVPLILGNPSDRVAIDGVFARFTIDAVVHFGCADAIDESTINPLEYYDRNVSGTKNLLEACIRSGARLVFASSAAVYGSSTAPFLDENSATFPISPLGRSLVAAEWMIADACSAHGLSAVVLRHFNIGGADPYMRTGDRGPKGSGLISLVAEAAIGARESIEVYGDDHPTPDGTCIRDYVHVADVADAYLGALRSLESGGSQPVVNVGYGRGCSVLEVIEAAQRLSGRKFPVKLLSSRPCDPSTSVSTIGRAHSLLKWKPRFDDHLDAILVHAIEWAKKRQRKTT
ncbi:UDP-glucose 4-epimerase GalE [Bradyrhizobium sp. USDA 4350]